MKTTLFFFTFVFLVATTPAQTDTSRSPKWEHELGLNFCLFRTTYNNFAKKFDFMYYEIGFVPGLYYKGHYGNHVVRASFDVQQTSLNSLTYAQRRLISYTSGSFARTTEARIGYQIDFGEDNFKIFVLSDLLAYVQHYENRMYIPGSGKQVVYQSTNFYYGLTGGSGIKLNLSPNIALSYELGASYLYVPTTQGKFDNFAIFLYPVKQLGLSFLF